MEPSITERLLSLSLDVSDTAESRASPASPFQRSRLIEFVPQREPVPFSKAAVKPPSFLQASDCVPLLRSKSECDVPAVNSYFLSDVLP